MRARVTFRMPDGSVSTATHGDLVGRLAQAAVHLDDARISEAHALVSLRGSELVLLALRGRFAVKGRPVDRVPLTSGLEIQLARRITLTVESVHVPEQVLALRGPNLPTQMLPNVASLVVQPEPALIARYVSGAALTLWSTGPAWRIRHRDGPAQPLQPGDTVDVDGHVFEALLVDVRSATDGATLREGGLTAPLHLVLHYDAAEVRRTGHGVLALSGLGARILYELAEIGAPVSWHALATDLWSGDRDDLRRKWDLTLARVRRKLRDAGIREDLVHPDGRGNVQLLLYSEDRCELRP